MYKIFGVVPSKSFGVTNQMSGKLPQGGTQQNFIWGGSAFKSKPFMYHPVCQKLVGTPFYGTFSHI